LSSIRHRRTIGKQWYINKNKGRSLEDRRKVLLDQQPFDYKEIKDNKIQIFFNGRLIKILHGSAYRKFKKN
jgi:hypothetical protein